MQEKNDLVINQINEFVENNKQNIDRVKKENPNLYGVVLDTLAFLNKRYGSAETLESLTKIEEAPVEEKSDIVQIEREEIPSIRSRKPLFSVGDEFTNSKYPSYLFVVERIDDEKAYLNVLDIDSKNKLTTAEKRLWEINNRIEDGTIKILPKVSQSSQPTPPSQIQTQLGDQERINEIKDAIDGLKVLADFGDQDAIDEIKKLKKELKTLKPSKK